MPFAAAHTAHQSRNTAITPAKKMAWQAWRRRNAPRHKSCRLASAANQHQQRAATWRCHILAHARSGVTINITRGSHTRRISAHCAHCATYKTPAYAHLKKRGARVNRLCAVLRIAVPRAAHACRENQSSAQISARQTMHQCCDTGNSRWRPYQSIF